MDTEVPVSANFWECIPVFSAFIHMYIFGNVSLYFSSLFICTFVPQITALKIISKYVNVFNYDSYFSVLFSFIFSFWTLFINVGFKICHHHPGTW